MLSNKKFCDDDPYLTEFKPILERRFRFPSKKKRKICKKITETDLNNKKMEYVEREAVRD